jgi:hypothetical protein
MNNTLKVTLIKYIFERMYQSEIPWLPCDIIVKRHQ